MFSGILFYDKIKNTGEFFCEASSIEEAKNFLFSVLTLSDELGFSFLDFNFSSVPSSQKEFNEAVKLLCKGERKKRRLAEAYLFHLFFVEKGMKIFPSKNRNPYSSLAKEKEIGFIANIPEWIAIKKVQKGNKEGKEIAATLASISTSIVRKFFPAFKPRKVKWEELNAFSSLEEALEKGVVCFLFLDDLIKVYPELKIPKPRGRFKR